MHGQLGWGANTAKIYCKALFQAICYMPDMPVKCNGKLLRCNTCHMMACVPHPNVHNCHHGKGGLEEGSKKGKSTAILQPVKVTKCNILQNVLHCTMHLCILDHSNNMYSLAVVYLLLWKWTFLPIELCGGGRWSRLWVMLGLARRQKGGRGVSNCYITVLHSLSQILTFKTIFATLCATFFSAFWVFEITPKSDTFSFFFLPPLNWLWFVRMAVPFDTIQPNSFFYYQISPDMFCHSLVKFANNSSSVGALLRNNMVIHKWTPFQNEQTLSGQLQKVGWLSLHERGLSLLYIFVSCAPVLVFCGYVSISCGHF